MMPSTWTSAIVWSPDFFKIGRIKHKKDSAVARHPCRTQLPQLESFDCLNACVHMRVLLSEFTDVKDDIYEWMVTFTYGKISCRYNIVSNIFAPCNADIFCEIDLHWILNVLKVDYMGIQKAHPPCPLIQYFMAANWCWAPSTDYIRPDGIYMGKSCDYYHDYYHYLSAMEALWAESINAYPFCNMYMFIIHVLAVLFYSRQQQQWYYNVTLCVHTFQY